MPIAFVGLQRPATCLRAEHMSKSRYKGRGKAASFDRALGRKIRKRRIERNLSLEKLGLELGISYQQMQKYELGTDRIPAARIPILAKMLGVGVAWFFYDSD